MLLQLKTGHLWAAAVISVLLHGLFLFWVHQTDLEPPIEGVGDRSSRRPLSVVLLNPGSESSESPPIETAQEFKSEKDESKGKPLTDHSVSRPVSPAQGDLLEAPGVMGPGDEAALPSRETGGKRSLVFSSALDALVPGDSAALRERIRGSAWSAHQAEKKLIVSLFEKIQYGNGPRGQVVEVNSRTQLEQRNEAGAWKAYVHTVPLEANVAAGLEKTVAQALLEADSLLDHGVIRFFREEEGGRLLHRVLKPFRNASLQQSVMGKIREILEVDPLRDPTPIVVEVVVAIGSAQNAVKSLFQKLDFIKAENNPYGDGVDLKVDLIPLVRKLFDD